MTGYNPGNDYLYNRYPQSLEPLDEYQNELIKDFYQLPNRKKILDMAIYTYKKRYGKKPVMTKMMLNWAMDNTIDRGQHWKQTERMHNLNIEASQRLVELMVRLDYDIHLDWFTVQEQKRDTSVANVCGSHFTDRQKYESVNIV